VTPMSNPRRPDVLDFHRAVSPRRRILISVAKPLRGHDQAEQSVLLATRPGGKIKSVATPIVIIFIVTDGIGVVAEAQCPQSFDLDRRTMNVRKLTEERSVAETVGIDTPVAEIADQ